MRRLWPIDGEERLQIPHLLTLWKYPRELIPGELAISWWYGAGTEALFWYNSGEGDPPRSAMLHVAIAPDAKYVVTRRELVAIELIAELRGLTLLITDPPTEHLREGLIRLGWQRREDGVLTRDLRSDDGP